MKTAIFCAVLFVGYKIWERQEAEWQRKAVHAGTIVGNYMRHRGRAEGHVEGWNDAMVTVQRAQAHAMSNGVNLN